MRMHHLFHRFAHHHHGSHAFFMDEGEHGYHAGRHGPFDEHHGGGAFGGWDGLRGGGRRGGGRMFGHGDLKLLLLALIEQQPRHGYELIRTIEEMFHGQYSPSPGAIYPILSMLEDMGYAQVESAAGNRKLYAITAEGRAFLDENRAAVDAVTARTEHSARIAAKMAAPMAVRKAMHALKHALLMRTDWDKAEAERVAAILQRAASDIAAARPHD
jgi:DNA-binding PadR family transcriptional regulator